MRTREGFLEEEALLLRLNGGVGKEQQQNIPGRGNCVRKGQKTWWIFGVEFYVKGLL